MRETIFPFGWFLFASALFISLRPAEVVAQVNPGDIIINEFVATNQDGLTDEDGDPEDWIELKNVSGMSLSLAGLWLTDATDNLLKWALPNQMLADNDFLLVFASDKDRATPGAELHANFKVNREGEYIALVDSASNVINEFLPFFPEQFPDFSYGIEPMSGQFRYLQPPTPGAENNASTPFQGFLEDVFFSHESGFFDAPFDVSALHADPLADIYYTVDGSTPTMTSTLFTTPLTVSDNFIFRARAFRTGFVPSRIATRTYLLSQTYGNPVIMPDEGIKSLPIISIVMPEDGLVGPLGFITNAAVSRGRAWERPGNVELFHADGTPGFNHTVGVRLHASGSSRSGGIQISEKFSLRLYFREEYGFRDLDFNLIPRSGRTSFKRIVLRAGKNDDTNPFIKDEWTRRTYGDTGQVSVMGSYAHLFLNGEFRGYYNPTERIGFQFMQARHGGDNEWDVFRSSTEAADGDDVALLELLNNAQTLDLSIPANYDIIDASLDIINFIDYLQVNVYRATGDWPGGNYAMAREKAPGAKFRFYLWDAEGVTENPGDNVFTNRLLTGSGAPIPVLYAALRVNSTFRQLWAERFRVHMYGDGAMVMAKNRLRWIEMRNVLHLTIPELLAPMPIPWYTRRNMLIQSHMLDEDLIQPFNDLDPRAIPKIAINEFMARNQTTISDEAAEFDDWIELYNLTASPLDVSGMFLTDNLATPTEWEIPAGTVIPPLGYIIIWADNDLAQGPLHASFALSGDGEEIGLFDTLANGNVLLDKVTFTPQSDDISTGRRPDGVGPFETLSSPSPGATNGAVTAVSNPTDAWAKLVLRPGQGVMGLETGDFNRDGSPDLAVADFNFGRVIIYMNDGPGTKTFSGPIFYPAALGAKGIAVGDLNNDAYDDIVTANDRLVDYTVTTLLNNMDGTFGAPNEFPLYSLTDPGRNLTHPFAVAVAHIDNDNNLDVIVSHESPATEPNFLTIFNGDGNGQLMNATELAMERFLFDAFGKNVIAEDLDGDNDTDLIATTDFRPLSVSLNLGGGTMGTATQTTGGLGRSAAITAADFNGDGVIDVAGCDAATLFHIYINKGDGSFEDAAFFFAPDDRELTVPAAGDFDLDGDNDLAIATTTRVAFDGPGIHIFVNDGSGGFPLGEEGYELPSPDDCISFPEDMVSVDFDGDTRPDLAVTDGMTGDLVVYFNQITPQTASVTDWKLYDR